MIKLRELYRINSLFSYNILGDIMNLSYQDKIILYINNQIINNVDLDDKDSIKEYFKNIFIKLKNIFNIELNGFYLVKVYKNINSIVIELENEELDYYDLYDEIDMKIELIETIFLYQIEDIFIDNK